VSSSMTAAQIQSSCYRSLEDLAVPIAQLLLFSCPLVSGC
jgi:hypothetical protein